MRKVLLLCFVSLQALAFETVTIGGGLLYNMPDSDDSNLDDENGISVQVGVIAKKEINPDLDFRTGVFYQRRAAVADTSIGDLEYTLDYLSVPLTISYKLEDDFSLIGGLSAGINIGDDCDLDDGFCDLEDPESLLLSLSLGVSKKLNDQLYGEVLLDKSLGELVDGLEMTSIIFNVLYEI